ncbi:MAG: copper resistance protein CopC [Arsenicicoccus sp.]|nr:MAG: copper resistance protein CopC [Arsenicicoccus sp.]
MSSRRLAPTLLVSLGLVLAPASAQAHDELTGTAPQDGASVEAGDLEDLTLTFSGEIADVGAAVAVTAPDGSSVLEGEPVVEGPEVTQDLVDDLGDGEYAVAWRVTSEDGHPISGEFGFTVTGAAQEDPAEESTSDAGAAEETTEAEESAAEATSETDPTDEEPVEEPSPEPTSEDDAAGQDTADEETAGASADASAQEPSGIPPWAWALVAVGAAGLLVLLGRTWSRSHR